MNVPGLFGSSTEFKPLPKGFVFGGVASSRKSVDEADKMKNWLACDSLPETGVLAVILTCPQAANVFA